MNVLINLVYCSVVVVVVIFAVTISSVKTQELCRMPNNSPGTCVPFNQCSFVKRLHERYQGNVPQAFYPYIQKLKCSRDNEPVVRLCCEPDTILRPTTATTQPSTGSINYLSLNTMQDYQSQLNAAGFNILNGQRCGTDNGNRIAGGNVTMLAEFPWMALLKYRGPSGDQFRCGGSLITNRYVLTAAHCVNTVDPVIGVRLGEYDTSTEEDCIKLGPRWRCNPPVEDIGIENIVAHPEYSKSKHVNDISLIKLDRNVEFKKHIEPICLPIFSNSVQTQPEDHFLIAGWGFTEKGSTSNVLLKAPVKQLPVSTCSQEYSIELSLTRHLCAGDDVLGRDTCGGDSGGPLIQFVPYNGKRRFVQYGVVASGRYACILKTTLPGVYTNVSNFMPWITHNIVV
ncbi:serine protease grass [Musca domestica]|uniref:CLIP domain-containing serine protease n=1 Tax=Musca domestica TaxID=7370 RepID=A0A9J7DCT0_MUSDO|nr:serine protease grass [Musca domestica]